jgi:heme/copper-type cytochrome/quinol oxidase subunit 2
MNLQLLIPLLVTSLITIFGWYILHKLAKKREQENKKKELRIDYLIDAWQKIEYASNRDINEKEFIEYVEKPIASIQLFGTLAQINLAQKIADEMGKNGTASLDSILEELRDDLRNELNLEKATTTMRYVRHKK